LKEFERFLNSPVFNTNSRLADLHGYLCKYHPELPAESCDKEMLFRFLYPTEMYEDTKIRLAISDLNKMLEQYLAFQHWRAQPQEVYLQLIKKLRKMGATEVYNRQIGQAPFSLESAWRYSDEERLRLLQFALERSEDPSRSLSRHNDNFLQEWNDTLDTHYLLAKLKVSIAMLNNQQMFQQQHRLTLLPELRSWLAEHLDKQSPVVRLFYLMLLLTENPDDPECYAQAAHYLRTELDEAPLDDQINLHAFIRNHCIRRINKGEQSFLTELLGWYQDALRRNLFVAKSDFSPWEFKNIVSLGLRLGELDWTEKFIDQHAPQIAEAYRDNAFRFNQARLHFAKGEYPKVPRLLQQVVFDDVFYSLDARVLLLKTYYERQDDISLFSLVASFKNYLRRNKELSNNVKTTYHNLVIYVSRLAKLTPGEKDKARQLQARLMRETQLADKTWLLEKARQLAE
jgi:hypothetical protein